MVYHLLTQILVETWEETTTGRPMHNTVDAIEMSLKFICCTISLYCHLLNWFQLNLIIKLSINFHHANIRVCQLLAECANYVVHFCISKKERKLFFLLEYTTVATFVNALETYKKMSQLAYNRQKWSHRGNEMRSEDVN